MKRELYRPRPPHGINELARQLSEMDEDTFIDDTRTSRMRVQSAETLGKQLQVACMHALGWTASTAIKRHLLDMRLSGTETRRMDELGEVRNAGAGVK